MGLARIPMVVLTAVTFMGCAPSKIRSARHDEAGLSNVEATYTLYLSCMKKMADVYKDSKSEAWEIAEAADVKCSGDWFPMYERALYSYLDTGYLSPMQLQEHVRVRAAEGRKGAKRVVIQHVVESRLPASP